MKEDKLHKYIEKQDPEGKNALKVKIMAQLPKESAPERTPVHTKRHVFSWVTACFCAVCLAVAFPLLIKDKTSERFSADINDYNAAIVNYTLKDYATEHNLPLLYLDWYSQENIEVTTWKKTHKSGKSSFFYEEDYLNGTIYDEVYVSVIDNNTIVKDLGIDIKSANKEKVNNVTVYWEYAITSNAQFTYKGYTYYIFLWDPPAHDAAVRIAESMLQTAR